MRVLSTVTKIHRRLLANTVFGAFAAVACSMAMPTGTSADFLNVEDISVVDGDTVQIGDTVYNLFGMDAPELGQRCLQNGRWNDCGITAAFQLKKLLNFDKPLRCERAEAHLLQIKCYSKTGNVAQAMIKAGYAVAASGSDEFYQKAEASAKAANLGLWHMAFNLPWDWRHGRRLSSEAAIPRAECPIKAIVDANGRKVYYVPTDANYKSITVNASDGGRRFCYDAEARMAGWRRPGEVV